MGTPVNGGRERNARDSLNKLFVPVAFGAATTPQNDARKFSWNYFGNACLSEGSMLFQTTSRFRAFLSLKIWGGTCVFRTPDSRGLCHFRGFSDFRSSSTQPPPLVCRYLNCLRHFVAPVVSRKPLG